MALGIYKFIFELFAGQEQHKKIQDLWHFMWNDDILRKDEMTQRNNENYMKTLYNREVEEKYETISAHQKISENQTKQIHKITWQ